MRIRSAPALATLVVLASCGDITSPKDELTAARQRWDAWGPASYDLIVQRGPCECIAWTDKVLVSVRNGVATRSYYPSGAPIDNGALWYPLVPEFFDEIATAIS